MKANPGGQIAPSDVIGRDKLIKNLWRVLESQSLVLCAERRMGKTCIVKKMVDEAPKKGLLCVYRDLEGIRTPLEFVEKVLHDVEDYLKRSTRTAVLTRQFLKQIGGTEVGGVLKIPNVTSHHWKVLLTKIMVDLVENQDRTVIFFWDEIPLMLYDIKKHRGNDEDAAMELLDTLRSLRQMHPKLRMVFTGSIGLHNVITILKQAGYANDPTNDMSTRDVPRLSPDDAQELACLLLKGEDISMDDRQATAQAIAEGVDGNPFYIHQVVSNMRDRRGQMENAATVCDIVSSCLTDHLDCWHMRHYRERIDIYYPHDEARDERKFALGLLDILSASDEPLAFHDLFSKYLKSHIETEDAEMARHVLTLLQRDHYVIQQADGSYCFHFPLIKLWWRLNRGLT